jgi:hypothetical protein
MSLLKENWFVGEIGYLFLGGAAVGYLLRCCKERWSDQK